MASPVDKHQIETKQNASVGIITSSKQYAHSDPLFEKLKILKFIDVIENEMHKFTYKQTNAV